MENKALIECHGCDTIVDTDVNPDHWKTCKCRHSGLERGKVIRINKQNRIVQVKCEWCESLGTLYEQREKHDSNTAFYKVSLIWHENNDYKSFTLA